jgi:hypothetical protein
LGAEPKVVADLLAMIAHGKLDNEIVVNANDNGITFWRLTLPWKPLVPVNKVGALP